MRWVLYQLSLGCRNPCPTPVLFPTSAQFILVISSIPVTRVLFRHRHPQPARPPHILFCLIGWLLGWAHMQRQLQAPRSEGRRLCPLSVLGTLPMASQTPLLQAPLFPRLPHWGGGVSAGHHWSSRREEPGQPPDHCSPPAVPAVQSRDSVNGPERKEATT